MEIKRAKCFQKYQGEVGTTNYKKGLLEELGSVKRQREPKMALKSISVILSCDNV
jgi:hypothetical protein